MKKVVIIPIAAAALIIPAALYFLGYLPVGETPEAIAEGDTVELDSLANEMKYGESFYLPLDPPFVVNFTHLGNLRFLQISLQVMYKDQELLDRVTEEMPAVRNKLILLLSDQDYEKLNSRSGKEKLREEMMLAINDVILDGEYLEDSGEIFITNFVMQ